ncbi:hypothetical protein DW322_00790 [Rhodococcus rhodnii]|uniref:HTH cro/C1-type domain-containing protein n=2 Tax=Rhodococcus rhodnii TaxID=38312 RepID=R7WR25_9NOCA|nr:hypothetical protein [Rhodococcus rhodnii]EOM77762.1 hypothetical protein Rrhod_0915 [Rhodococcus rhodnii LMG 5362]TXG89041.1 hypothetical protein DW322_00790 [Rhodococcus rhodnii]
MVNPGVTVDTHGHISHEIANRVRSAIDESDTNAYAIACALGIPPTTFRRHVLDGGFSATDLIRIARHLDRPPADLWPDDGVDRTDVDDGSRKAS